MSRFYVRNGVHYGTADEMIDLIEELEAKLAKAVDCIEWILIGWDYHCKHGYSMQDGWEDNARATLAELTGGPDAKG